MIKKLNITRSPFDVLILLFVVVSGLSAFLTTNRIMNLVGDPLLYAGSFLLFLLITNLITKGKRLSILLTVITGAASLLAIWSLVNIKIPVNFTPPWSQLTQLLFLVATVPLAFGNYFKRKNALTGVILAIIVFGVGATFYTVYKSPPALLPVETGWKIAAGTMGRSLLTAVFGIGPANYLDAFSLYKPGEFNSTSIWNLRFPNGANYYFYLLSTVGIAGFGLFAALIYKLVTLVKKEFEKSLLVSLGLIVVMFLFLPAPAILIALFFVLLGIFVCENPEITKKQEITINPLPVLIVAGLIFASGIFLGKIVLADYYFTQSLKAAAANDGTKTYNLQIQAINLNPDNDAYHVSYSQTNLALADSLAGQQNLTDQQKNTVIQLVQQAIREGRSATALNPNRASNWENLSLIYRSLINFAQGADQWTLTSINQAIALDPTNPRLRLDLGSLYFAGKDYAAAGQMFSQAVNLKPDYANAHYNLAQALKNMGSDDQAKQELQTTASLVCGLGQTADCDNVNKEIADLNIVPVASPSAALTPATASAKKTNLPKVKTSPPAKISSPSGEITP